MNTDQTAINKLKLMGRQRLIDFQRTQRAISLVIRDTTGEAAKRDRLMTLAIGQMVDAR